MPDAKSSTGPHVLASEQVPRQIQPDQRVLLLHLAYSTPLWSACEYRSFVMEYQKGSVALLEEDSFLSQGITPQVCWATLSYAI